MYHYLHNINICKKNNSYIDEELMKSQIESIKENEKTHYNIPDPVFSNDRVEGQLVPGIIYLTSFIREFVRKKIKKARIYYNNNKDKEICF